MNVKEQMVRRLNSHAVEVSLPSKLGYERIAMDCSASFAKMAGFAQDRIEDLKTAVAEACLNAIEHGNKGNPDTRVLVPADEAFSFGYGTKRGLRRVPVPDIEGLLQRLDSISRRGTSSR